MSGEAPPPIKASGGEVTGGRSPKAAKLATLSEQLEALGLCSLTMKSLEEMAMNGAAGDIPSVDASATPEYWEIESYGTWEWAA